MTLKRWGQSYTMLATSSSVSRALLREKMEDKTASMKERLDLARGSDKLYAG
jgi:hypothetical protein